MNLFEKLKKKESLKEGAATALAATVLAGSMNAAIKNDSINENNNDIDAMKQPEPTKTVSSVSAKSNFTVVEVIYIKGQLRLILLLLSNKKKLVQNRMRKWQQKLLNLLMDNTQL